MTERNYEAEAVEQGWTPKEDWKGAEDKWTDAQTFVERGEKIAGILKSRLDKQDHEISNLKDANKKFGEYHKKTLEAQQKKDADKIQELKTQIAQAVTDGDGQAYTKLSNDIEDLKANQTVPTDDAQAWAQLSQGWVSDNPWYTENRKLARYADGISDEIRGEGYNGQAYFSELTRRVHEDFPEEFKNPNKAKANVAETDAGQRSTTNSKAKTYENLDSEAKRACDDFVAQGFMTRDQYVAQYEFED